MKVSALLVSCGGVVALTVTEISLLLFSDMIADWMELKASLPAGQVIDQQMLYAGSGRAFSVGVKVRKDLTSTITVT
eukprot:SAG11_NODE_1128_length_5762_cov_2.633763_4_plen_77_part_00